MSQRMGIVRPAASENIELRPSASHYLHSRRAHAGQAIPMLALVAGNVFVVVHSGGTTRARWLEIAATVAGLALVATLLLFLRTKVVIDDGGLTLVRAFLPSRRFAHSEISGVASRTVKWNAADLEYAIVYGRGNRCLWRARRDLWSAATIQVVVQRYGHGHASGAERVDSVRLESEFPGSVPLWERHPWVVASVGVITVV